MRITTLLKSIISLLFVLCLVSCGERTRLDANLSGDDQDSLNDDTTTYDFLSGTIHYDQNSHLLSMNSTINDKANGKLNFYEYVIDVSTDQFVFLKNQTAASEGKLTCIRKSLGLCVELDVEFPGLVKKISAKFGQMEIEQTETATKASYPMISATWPRSGWKNNNLPWIHYAALGSNPIGVLELPNYNTNEYLILPGTLDYKLDFYTWSCKTTLLALTDFQVDCDYYEKMTSLKTTKKWLIQFSF